MKLARKNRSTRGTKQHARKRRRTKKQQETQAAVHYRSLLAILVFLYMLRLIDEKTFNKVKNALSPPRAAKRKRTKSKRPSRKR